jgi:putative Mn2+ efflux pump MntP
MDPLFLLLISLGLGTDCFAVSLAVGTGRNISKIRIAAILALVFGGFQFGMNVIGWATGEWLLPFISGFVYWIVLILLAAIGVKMIYDGLRGEEERMTAQISQAPTLLILAVATSIDSLGVGFSFALLAIAILIPAFVIGTVTALLSLIGVLLGNRLTERFGEGMEVMGGIILIGLGLRIWFENLSP